jgi:hypothetical protein
MTLYNPHFLARQVLIETFVARRDLLDELVDDLRRGGKQHHLLVGDRGSGKTTLLLRLAYAIEEDAKLKKRFVALRFPEEQYNISRAADFWMNCVDALADALEQSGCQAEARKLTSLVADDGSALEVLEAWTKRSQRSIVLLVDNLGLVLERLRNEQWALRDALSRDNGLVVIGASPRIVEAAITYDAPFYDFFNIHQLAPLSEDEARAMVQALAQRDNTPRVSTVLEQDPSRFKALFALSGGSPRTVAALYTVLAMEARGDIEHDLQALLDQLTPYYKARVDELPAQSQLIVDVVALRWHPITAADCAKATGLKVNVTSAQLDRLVKSGMLAKVALRGAKLGFQVAERFFNIWYLMRASRRQRAWLIGVAQSLKLFFSGEELEKRGEAALATEDVADPVRMLALASAIDENQLRRHLQRRAIAALADMRDEELFQYVEVEEGETLLRVADRARVLKTISPKLAASRKRWPVGTTGVRYARAITSSAGLSMTSKIAAADLIPSNATVNRVIEFFAVQEGDFGKPFLDAVGRGELPALRDITTTEEMDLAVRLAKLGSRDPWLALVMMLELQEKAGKVSNELVEHAIKIDYSMVSAVLGLATDHVRGGRLDRAHELARFAFRRPASSDTEEWVATLEFCRTMIQQKLTARLQELLLEVGAERMVLLQLALKHLDNPDDLNLLAPEIRGVVEFLTKKLQESEPPARPSKKRKQPSR